MKVAAFIFDLSKGGAQGVFVNVVNYLYENNIDIEVVVQNLQNAVYKDVLIKEIKITSLDVPNARKLLLVLENYLKINMFTHALAFSPEIAIDLYILRKKLGLNFKIIGRCINTLSYEYKHSNNFFRGCITRSLVQIFYHRIDLTIAQSEGMADDLIKNWGFKKNQIIVINNAMQPLYEKVMQSSSIHKKENYIMYAGRLEEQKGLKMLLEAFSKIKDKDVLMKLIGSGSQKQELQKISDKLHISDRVQFIEYTPDIIDYYKHAKLTVLTSYFEGFPNVLVESIACGTPVVSYDLPSGPSEIIINDQNGYLVPYLDVDKFSEILDYALKNEWDIEKVKATAARYSREQIMSKYMDVLKGF